MSVVSQRTFVKLGGSHTLYLLSSFFGMLNYFDLNARTTLELSMITPAVMFFLNTFEIML